MFAVTEHDKFDGLLSLIHFQELYLPPLIMIRFVCAQIGSFEFSRISQSNQTNLHDIMTIPIKPIEFLDQLD